MLLIINGKSNEHPTLRRTVMQLRKEGIPLDVRVTWEAGDVARFIHEAAAKECRRVIVGGGDGTLHEAVNGLMALTPDQRPTLGIVPLGTANDFATAAGIPADPGEALTFAVRGTSFPIDVGLINDVYFLNMASGGFGAKVTASTPAALKKTLGGGAYSLVGAFRFLNFSPYKGRLKLPGLEEDVSTVIFAIGNGRQAGGAQELAPRAYIDDGLLDVLVLKSFRVWELPRLIRDLERLAPNGNLVRYFQVPSLEFECDEAMPINLDGEMQEYEHISMQVQPLALDVTLPKNCKLLLRNLGDSPRDADAEEFISADADVFHKED